MSAWLLLGVGVAGGLGAAARFLLDAWVSRRLERPFPSGTLTVNLLGAFLLGLLVGAALGHDGEQLAGTGLIGGFTTFSTWMLESHRLGEDGRVGLGAINLAVSLTLGLLLAWAGRAAGAAL